MLLFSKGTLALYLSLSLALAAATTARLDEENDVMEVGKRKCEMKKYHKETFWYKCFSKTNDNPNFRCGQGVSDQENLRAQCDENEVLWKVACKRQDRIVCSGPNPVIKVNTKKTTKFYCFKKSDDFPVPSKDEVCTHGGTHGAYVCDCEEDEACFRAENCPLI